jgi:signal transduction histidine kinase
MGMGLPICRSIIEDHCSRLWASPNVEHGSACFRQNLPIFVILEIAYLVLFTVTLSGCGPVGLWRSLACTNMIENVD